MDLVEHQYYKDAILDGRGIQPLSPVRSHRSAARPDSSLPTVFVQTMEQWQKPLVIYHQRQHQSPFRCSSDEPLLQHEFLVRHRH